MSDPRRLSFEANGAVIARLLLAARVSAPPGAKQRALLAASASLAPSSASAASTPASSTAVGAKAGSLAAAKWAGVVGVVAIGAVAGAAIFHSARVHVPPPSHVVTATGDALPTTENSAATANVPLPPERSPVADLVPQPAPPAMPTPRLPAKSPDPGVPNASTVPAEIAMLEQAHRALSEGDAAHALSRLDVYSARFPRGAMAHEAAVLRIEALVQAGDRVGATRFANRFLAAHPRSPYAARIRSLLASEDP